MNYVWVAAGAALGGVLRYAVASAISSRWGAAFPWGTLIVNITGCFLIGVILTRLDRSDARLMLLLVTGFLGGYTTFSAFGWETYSLIVQGETMRALVYALASTAVGVAAVAAGVLVSRP